MSRLSQVKQKAPELLTDPSVVEMAEQADHLHKLKTLADSDNGKELVRILLQDVVNSVHQLGGMYITASHAELVNHIARMNAHLSTARLLVNSAENLEFIDSELAEMLRE
jgi:hypothetical protein